jgi:hypothetical protein
MTIYQSPVAYTIYDIVCLHEVRGRHHVNIYLIKDNIEKGSNTDTYRKENVVYMFYVDRRKLVVTREET